MKQYQSEKMDQDTKPERDGSSGVLHPLDHLEGGDEVDVVVDTGDIGHPFVEDLGEALV